MNSKKDLFESIRDYLNNHTDFRTMEEELWQEFGGRYATLVLDCCKFTRITQEKGIVHYLVCVMKLNDIVKPIFEKHGCLSYRPEEDNIYAEFNTPDQALEASIEANHAVKGANLMLNEHEPFEICIGIGYGDVLRSRLKGVFGDEMNLASKLGEDIAGGREILLTEAAYATIKANAKKHFERKHIVISQVPITYYCLRIADDDCQLSNGSVPNF